MISLTVSAENATEFFRQLSGAVGALKTAAVGAPPAPAAPVVEPVKQEGNVVEQHEEKVLEGEVIPPKQERKKRETKKETVIEAKAEQIDIEESIAEKIADIKADAIDDVRRALKKLADAKGEEPVFETLKAFGAKNASTVPEEKRADLIAAVDALIAQQESE